MMSEMKGPMQVYALNVLTFDALGAVGMKDDLPLQRSHRKLSAIRPRRD